LSLIAEKLLGSYAADLPGSGAAGGLGFGLSLFAGASLQPGFHLFSQRAQLEKRLRSAHLVITGEGSIDRSSFMGKGVGEIANLCRRWHISCLGLGGITQNRELIASRFTWVKAMTDLTSPDLAKSQPDLWLERLSAEVSRQLTGSPDFTCDKRLKH